MANDRDTGVEFDLSELQKYADKFPQIVIATALEMTADALAGASSEEAPVKEGRLSTDIGSRKINDLTYWIIIGALYWPPIQFGRKEIVPINAKVLRFEINGEIIFCKFARATEPNPFLDRAIDRVEPLIPDFVSMALERIS